MERRIYTKGSMTIMVSLLIMMVFATLFAFLELSRVYGLKENVILCTEQAEDTVMASYQKTIWKEYRLLFYEEQEGDLPAMNQMLDLQKDAIEGNWAEAPLIGNNFFLLQVHLDSLDVSAYELATDNGGLAFRKEAAQMMKESVAEETLKTLLDMDQNSEQSENDDAKEEALDTLDGLKSQSARKAAQAETDSQAEETDANKTVANNVVNGTVITRKDNPLQWVKDISSKGVLAIVMPEKEISEKSFDTDDSLSKRSLQKGNYGGEAGLTTAEEMLFRIYLGTYYDNVMEHGDGTLDYEVEYIVAGKDSDQANLKAVVNRLLLMREGTNLLFLETNPARQEEAIAVAAAITSVLGVPEFEEVAKQGVLAAWAYAESLSDVKILLDGGKVEPIKTEAGWHTDLLHLSSSLSAVNGQSGTSGLTYENYLQVLMWAMKDETLSMRAMDVIEINLDVQMDCMVCRMEGTYGYKAEPLFWKFVTLEKPNISEYQFQEKGSFSYLLE